MSGDETPGTPGTSLEETLTATRAELEAVRRDLGDTRAQLTDVASRLAALADTVGKYALATDVTRSRADVPESLVEAFWRYRESRAYQTIYETARPRVSVCIATYNRARLLVERCLPSVLAQSYPNVEVIVVGDGCTDETACRVAELRDARLRFVNRTEHSSGPLDPEARWMVAGTSAINDAMELATGDLITHLDDDDEFLPDRIVKLVDSLRETRAEFVHHPYHCELSRGRWILNGTAPLPGQLTTGSVMYLAWLKKIPWDPKAYLYAEPGDWNRFRKFKYLGVRMTCHPEPLLRHYRERTQHVLPSEPNEDPALFDAVPGGGEAGPPALATSRGVRFGDLLILERVTTEWSGDDAVVRLSWRAGSTSESECRMIVQLVDSEGRSVAELHARELRLRPTIAARWTDCVVVERARDAGAASLAVSVSADGGQLSVASTLHRAESHLILPMPFDDGAFVKGSSEAIFQVFKGVRRWVPDLATFLHAGGRPNLGNVSVLSDALLAAIPEGTSLPRASSPEP